MTSGGQTRSWHLRSTTAQQVETLPETRPIPARHKPRPPHKHHATALGSPISWAAAFLKPGPIHTVEGSGPRLSPVPRTRRRGGKQAHKWLKLTGGDTGLSDGSADRRSPCTGDMQCSQNPEQRRGRESQKAEHLWSAIGPFANHSFSDQPRPTSASMSRPRVNKLR